MSGSAEKIEGIGNITVASMDELGQRIRRSRINFAPIQQRWEKLEGAWSAYPYVSGIDPYSDTYFNARQRPRLVEELARLRSEIGLENLRPGITSLMRFIRRVRPYRLVCFIGD